MAWPFTVPAVFTYDSGFAALSTTPGTVITASTVYVMGMHFVNTTAADITINITDTAGGAIIDDQVIPAHGIFQPPSWNLMPCVGLRGDASAVGVTAKIWGW